VEFVICSIKEIVTREMFHVARRVWRYQRGNQNP